MTPTTTSIGFLLVAQAIVTTFVAALFWSLYFGLARRQRFFVWWAWAWTCLAVQFVAAAAAHMGDPQATTLSAGLEFIPVLAGFVAIPFVVFGARDFLEPDRAKPTRWRLAVLLAAALALVIDLISYAPAFYLSIAQGLLRTAPRQGLMGVALLWCGYAFFRSRERAASHSVVATAFGWSLWGLGKLTYAVVGLSTASQLVFGVAFLPLTYNRDLRIGLTLVDFVFQLLLALAMVVLLAAQQRRAVAAVAEAEERYRAFVRNAAEGVWRSEPSAPIDITVPVEEQVRRLIADARLVECNDAMAAMYGYPHPAAMLGRRVWAHCDDGDERNLESLRAFVRSGYRQTQAETHETDGQGRTKIFLNNRLGIVEDGRLVRVWGTQLDITELTRLQASLRRAETMSALGSLVAGVAHEVRNPLFSMTATLDAFEARYGSREEYRKHLEVLRAQLDRLTGLMRDLLDYGKPTSLDLATVAVDAVVRQAAEACGPAARSARVRIECACAADAPPVRGDRVRLGQAVANVIENAVQHSPPGCTVLVTAGVARGDGQSWVEVRVRDAGPGFGPEDLPHLFEPFFTKRRGGTGLGLSLVQRTVERHGGEVSARNHEAGGAELLIRLPVPAAPPSAAGRDA